MTDTLHVYIDQLNHPDRNVRSNVALSLGRLGEREALDALLTALCHEPDVLVREDITWALVRFGVRAVQPLIDLLRHPDAPVRHHAAHVLGKIRDTRAVDALAAVLTDESPMVIQKAAFSLNQIGDERVIPALVAVLGHPDSEVRTALMKVLENFGAAAVPDVLTALVHPKWQVREQAIDILGQIGERETLPDAINLLTDEHWEVRFSAVNAVAHLGNKISITAALTPMLNDEDARVQNLASEVLARLNQPRKTKLPSI